VPGENPGTEPVAVAHAPPVAVRVAPPTVVASAPLAPPPPAVAPPPTRPVLAAAPVAAPRPVLPVAEMAAAGPGPYDAHCKAVAHQRAADARANGYSFSMADVVYDGTYKDCVVWDTLHGSGVSR
jgi:hypothetical protein